MNRRPPAWLPWLLALVAMLIGLPLFFETGLVLLLPIVASAAAALPAGQNGDTAKLKLMLPALSGLSVVHALVPPHPGPLLAVNALGANLGLTLLYGLIVGIPTAIIAGPVLARFTAPGVKLNPPLLDPVKVDVATPSVGRALAADVTEARRGLQKAGFKVFVTGKYEVLLTAIPASARTPTNLEL
mgnify:CR=1 FL=1